MIHICLLLIFKYIYDKYIYHKSKLKNLKELATL
jgi:hypothetical protein